MSDGIQPIRHNIQRIQIKKKGSLPDSRNKKENREKFTDVLREKGERKDERGANNGNRKMSVDPIHDGDLGATQDNNLSSDGTSGTMIDTEV